VLSAGLVRHHLPPCSLPQAHQYTGAQGNSVVRSLIQNPEFEVRCITRDKASRKAQAVANLGVEVFQADTADADALQTALAGSWGVFINIATEVRLSYVGAIFLTAKRLTN